MLNFDCLFQKRGKKISIFAIREIKFPRNRENFAKGLIGEIFFARNFLTLKYYQNLSQETVISPSNFSIFFTFFKKCEQSPNKMSLLDFTVEIETRIRLCKIKLNFFYFLLVLY